MSLAVKKYLKSVNIWQSYKHVTSMVVPFILITRQCTAKRARDNHVLACNFAKYSLVNFFYRNCKNNRNTNNDTDLK